MKIVNALFPVEPDTAPIAGGNLMADTTSTPLPKARPDALSIAGQLCAARASHVPPLLLLFATPTIGLSASLLIYETGLALHYVVSAPVLLVDLGGSSGTLTSIYARTHRSDVMTQHNPWVIEGEARFALARLMEPNVSLLTAVSSERFTSFLEFARTRFSAILFDAGSVPDSVVGVLAAGHCDGVVLCIRLGKSTLTEVETAHTLFGQANSKIVGFVFDEIS